MKNFCFILALFLAGCGTPGGSHGNTYHAGPFTMNLPSDLKPQPITATDAYVGAFENNGIYLTFDYSMSANDFEDWPTETEFELVVLDEKEARIGTLHRGFRPGFAYSTQIAFRDTGGKYLTVTAACKTPADCNRAKAIFRSIKFKPSRE